MRPGLQVEPVAHQRDRAELPNQTKLKKPRTADQIEAEKHLTPGSKHGGKHKGCNRD